MNTRLQKLLSITSYLYLYVRSYFPENLPVGMTAFKAYVDRLYTLTGPIADKESITFAFASQIMHTDASKSAPPMQYFVRRLRKTAANQVAGQAFQDIKTAQVERAAQQQKAEELAKQQPGEAIASTTEGNSNEQRPQVL